MEQMFLMRAAEAIGGNGKHFVLMPQGYKVPAKSDDVTAAGVLEVAAPQGSKASLPLAAGDLASDNFYDMLYVPNTQPEEASDDLSQDDGAAADGMQALLGTTGSEPRQRSGKARRKKVRQEGASTADNQGAGQPAKKRAKRGAKGQAAVTSKQGAVDDPCSPCGPPAAGRTGRSGSADFGRNLAAGLAASGGRANSRGSAATIAAAGEGVYMYHVCSRSAHCCFASLHLHDFCDSKHSGDDHGLLRMTL
ncbi:TPA: hypothetical protein ACH3X2_009604 [Trebouxia sp. C0005]